jgi:hypothetical protein
VGSKSTLLSGAWSTPLLMAIPQAMGAVYTSVSPLRILRTARSFETLRLQTAGAFTATVPLPRLSILSFGKTFRRRYTTRAPVAPR